MFHSLLARFPTNRIPPLSPPELNPPRATNLFLLLKSPSSFRRSCQLSRASSPLFPNISFRLGMGEREGVLGNLGKSFRRQSDAQTLPPPPPSFALCVCVIRKKASGSGNERGMLPKSACRMGKRGNRKTGFRQGYQKTRERFFYYWGNMLPSLLRGM